MIYIKSNIIHKKGYRDFLIAFLAIEIFFVENVATTLLVVVEKQMFFLYQFVLQQLNYSISSNAFKNVFCLLK